MTMAKADMLPLIVFALAIGIGITAVGKKGQPLLTFFDSLAEVSYKLISMIMNLAPYGVFALLVPVVAANGPKLMVQKFYYHFYPLSLLFISVVSFMHLLYTLPSFLHLAK